MFGYLRRVCMRIANTLSPVPPIRFGNAGRDELPPVLGPGEWSHGLLAGMADSGTAWYFDRR